MSREAREQDFWGHRVPTLDEALHEFKSGPDPNTALMLDSVEPLQGAHVLDFACGSGVTTAWLAARGAVVTALDVSTESLVRARELLDACNLDARLVNGILSEDLAIGPFDAVVGRYALHHIDVESVAPVLADALRFRGRAAFVETFSSNPLLRYARRYLIGRFGIERYGTDDEHPLTETDTHHLRLAFGAMRVEVAEMQFMRILDRQLFKYRLSFLSRVCSQIDDFLLRRFSAKRLSYHQVIVLTHDRKLRRS